MYLHGARRIINEVGEEICSEIRKVLLPQHLRIGRKEARILRGSMPMFRTLIGEEFGRV